MKINIVSDLHYYDRDNIYPDNLKRYIQTPKLDFSKFQPADILVIAGDLGICNTDSKLLLEKIKRLKLYKHIVYCYGNHDYWYDNYGNFTTPNYNYIIDEYKVKFTCATMWAPIKRIYFDYMSKKIHDYAHILKSHLNPKDDSIDLVNYITCDDINEKFQIELDILKKSVQFKEGIYSKKRKEYKHVIVTHHVPRAELVQDKVHLSAPYIQAFCVMNGFCDCIKPDLWIFGHDHTSAIVDQEIDGTRYVKNCLRDMNMHIREKNYNYIIDF